MDDTLGDFKFTSRNIDSDIVLQTQISNIIFVDNVSSMSIQILFLFPAHDRIYIHFNRRSKPMPLTTAVLYLLVSEIINKVHNSYLTMGLLLGRRWVVLLLINTIYVLYQSSKVECYHCKNILFNNTTIDSKIMFHNQTQ